MNISGLIYIVGFQLLAKIFTTLFGLFSTRLTSIEDFGIFNVQLLTQLQTTLFLIRICFRKSHAKFSKESKYLRWNYPSNTIFTILPFGCIILFGSRIIFKRINPNLDVTNLNFISFAIFLEILSEPFFLLHQSCCNYKYRSIIEFCANVSKTFVTFVLLIKKLGVKSFIIAQIIYSLTIFIGYFLITLKNVSLIEFFTGNRIEKAGKRMILKDTLYHFFKSIFDLLFGYFEQIAAILFINEKEQGIFALINNLFGYFLQLINGPIEELVHYNFAVFKMKNNQKDQSFVSQNIDQFKVIFAVTCRWALTLVLGILSFGYQFLPILGVNKEDLPLTYNTFIVFSLLYLLFTVNGLIEAIASAVTDSKIQLIASPIMGVFIVIFARIFIRSFGLLGLIYASMSNCMIRLVFNFYFIKKSLKINLFFKLLPSMPASLSFCALFILSSRVYHFHIKNCLLATVGIQLLNLAIIYLLNKDDIVKFIQLFKNRSVKQKIE
eukprot:TRINITY_DN851_c0_g1_i1.p1 TRINITY_DN851_c0_g1~~TRINITY_DN851_c0_g1_i1.p1  ORF type:complete len:494 (-),score=95.93 TRINITY_DN851_c0_g1_i1:44-1525(-)